MGKPWDTGDPTRNWLGYFIPGSAVLRNRVGVNTAEELRDAENDLVEARVIELREHPGALGPRTYDLAFLQAIHRHLFQDVYDWAGEVRTVGIEKDGEAFCPPGSVTAPMDHIAMEIVRQDRLKSVAPHALPRAIAYLYDYVNFAHPFREGNGRATREFFEMLTSERRAGLDWTRTDINELHSACHRARAVQDLAPLVAMFSRILDSEPGYAFDQRKNAGE